MIFPEKAKRAKPKAGSSLANKVDKYISATSSANRGDIGEKIAKELIGDLDGYIVYPCKLNGSDNGFDIVAIKGSLDNPTAIRIIESKSMNNNSITLSITKGKGVQMSGDWKTATIDQMRFHATDENLNKIGDILFKNQNKIESFITTVDKTTNEIVLLKLNDF